MNPYPLLRSLLFRFNAETAHTLAIHGLALTPSAVLRAAFGPIPKSPVSLWNLTFPNPVGLAAGMDKNAEALPAWGSLGFGFVELGTVTRRPQPGNDKPRCFRRPAQHALINRMGFNNIGAQAMADRLASLHGTPAWPRIPVGINLGKNKTTPAEEAPTDYAEAYRLLRPFGDYFVINVSSPNTPGLRALQDRDSLTRIAEAIRACDATAPLLVKIAPDLSDEAVRDLAAWATKENLDGLIATNTTLDHSSIPSGLDEQGGLSGAPLRRRSTEVIRILSSATSLPIIASGGIMNAEAAVEKLQAGARLIQIYTGFVYRGPTLIREIVRSLPRS